MISGTFPYGHFVGKLQSCTVCLAHACIVPVVSPHACYAVEGRQSSWPILWKYADLQTCETSIYRCSVKMSFFTLNPPPHTHTLLQPLSKNTEATDSLLAHVMGLLQSTLWHHGLRWSEDKCSFRSREIWSTGNAKWATLCGPEANSLACVFLTTAVDMCSCIPIYMHWSCLCAASCSDVPFFLLMKRQF